MSTASADARIGVRLISNRDLATEIIDVVIEADANTLITWVSPSVTDVLGWDPAELLGRSAADLVHPDDMAAIARLAGIINETGGRVQATSCRMIGRDGKYRGLRLRGRGITDAHGRVIGHLIILQDTTERDAAMQALATLTEAGRVLIRATDEASLLDQMCAAIVDAGRYAFSWYGIPIEDEEMSVRPLAQAGGHESYLESVTISWGDGPTAQGPTGACIRTGATVASQDFAEDPAFEPWRGPASREGFRSSISLPVRVHGQVVGALMVYSNDAHVFDARARELLEDLAADLGLGIERLRAIEQLSAERARLVAALDSQFDPFVLLEEVRDGAGAITDLRFVEANGAACRFSQRSHEQIIGATLFQLFPEERRARMLDVYTATIQAGEPIVVDDYPYRHSSSRETVRLDVRAVPNGDRIAITFRDVTDRYEEAIRLAASEQRYRLVAENASDVVLLADADFTVKWASPSSERTLGVAPEDLEGTNAVRFFHPGDVPHIAESMQRGVRDGTDVRVRYRWRRAGTGYVWLETAAHSLAADGTGDWVVSIRDVDDEVRAREDLAAREERYRMLAENMSDLVWHVAVDGTITWASESLTRVLGWSAEDVVGRVAMEFIDPADRERAQAGRDESMSGRATYGEYRVRCADSSSRWMGFTISPNPTAEGMARIDAMRDIQDEVLTRGELAFAVEHDHITGLPTRQVALTRIEGMIAVLGPGREAGVLCVGVDGLATINDGLTYAAGDRVLVAVAERLVAAVGNADLLGRGTGDEFIVLVPQLHDPADAAKLADRIRLAMRDPMAALGSEVLLTVSIGIGIGRAGDEAARVLADAVVALRQAKQNGRDRFEFVDADRAAQAQARLTLEADIRHGLASGEFVPWFQPVVSMRDGEVVGHEALVRWMRDGVAAMPAEFLPVAELSPLIHDIDVAVLRQALSALAWLPDRTFVSVNASSLTLASQSYGDEVEEALRTTGADPARLHLEITETALLDLSAQVTVTMTRVAALGVRWYVDDFGIGYSSVSHLRDLPIAGLKLDLSFTRGIGSGDVTSVRLAQGLAGLAEGLELDTIAEGVETEFEASILHSQGWSRGQGWLYGRAAPLEPSPSASTTVAGPGVP